jgi:hypothetical protein
MHDLSSGYLFAGFREFSRHLAFDLITQSSENRHEVVRSFDLPTLSE